MNVARQMLWEEECSARGSERYYAHQDRLRASGQGDMTDVSSVLIRDRLQDAADCLEEQVNANTRGRQASYNSTIRSLVIEEEGYLKLAFIAMKAILRNLQLDSNKNTATNIARDIAKRVEVDYKCRLFEAAHTAYYDTVRKSFAEQNVTDYVHRQKVLMKKFNDFDLQWENWSNVEQVHIGTRILSAVLNTFGDVVYLHKKQVRNKTVFVIETVQEFDEWAAEFDKESGLLAPLYLPLKSPPRPWTSLNNGGYHTPAMKLAFIKTKGRGHKKYVSDKLPRCHMDAVNKLQRTAWKVNSRVLAVQQQVFNLNLGVGIPSSKIIEPPEFPEHLQEIDKEHLTDSQKEEIGIWKNLAKFAYGEEEARKGRVLAFLNAAKLARELNEWDKLYFVYTCDFRGRIYCATSGLSPQGADSAKGLLQFAKGKPLRKDGVKWLAIQGANTYGVDKVDFDDRVRWVQDNEQYIRAVVEDPLDNRDFWAAADKPYQFLAFCFEWSDCDYGRNLNALSSIPVGLDGSCNGLQHFSAMLRDNVGAKATNLVRGDKPEDIYQQVADLTMELLKEQDDALATLWLKVLVSRKCAKKPVMTLPYGATQSSARDAVLEYVKDNWNDFGNLSVEYQWFLAKYLTPILWKAIGKTVVAAREGMDWLQKSIPNTFVSWRTVIGFPVYQNYADLKSIKVITQLEGKVTLRVEDNNIEVGESKRSAQRSGIAPNFVHSLDSTHLVMTTLDTKLDAYAMIHDDYGTHAADTEKLYKQIPQSFFKLYNSFDPLDDWANQVGADKSNMPKRGTYDINEIRSANYFFG